MDGVEVANTPMVLFTINKTHGKHVPLSIPEVGTVKFPNVVDVQCEGEIARVPRNEFAILTNSSLIEN